jgi:lincosamide nucleotidyltransferase A/C/D/E
MQMTASAVRDLLVSLREVGIQVWLDGGWGVDALLGRETRAHHDVDIIVTVNDVPKLLDVCHWKDFTIREGSPPHAFVLADGFGHQVDVHAVTFNSDGSAAHRMDAEQDWMFSAESFAGSGAIGGMQVSCLSAEAQVRCHAQGYAPTNKDVGDMELLREKFGVELPPSLQRASDALDQDQPAG